MRKRPHLVTMIALVLGLAGCGSGSTEPVIDPATAPITGTYDLVSTNGSSLPATFVSNGTTVTIQSDVFVLGDGGAWSETYTATETRNGTTTPANAVRTGFFVRSGASVSFRNTANAVAYSGSFTGRGLIVTDIGARSYSFAKR